MHKKNCLNCKIYAKTGKNVIQSRDKSVDKSEVINVPDNETSWKEWLKSEYMHHLEVHMLKPRQECGSMGSRALGMYLCQEDKDLMSGISALVTETLER